MKKLIFIALISIKQFVSASTTDQEAAFASDKGIYINVSYEYPLALPQPVTGYEILRKETSESKWTKIIQYAVPDTREEFFANLTKANAYTPEFIDKSIIPYNDIWDKISRYKTLDSVPVWRNALIIRLALGITIYDASGKENVDYEYSIKKIMANGEAVPYFTSNNVSFPGKYAFPAPMFKNAETNKEQITIKYSVPGNEILNFFRVMRSDDHSNIYTPVKCSRYAVQTDTGLILVFSDTTIKENHIYNYFVIPFNFYGALASHSDTARTAAYDPKQISLPFDLQVFYDKNYPGLSISWDCKSTTNISGFNIYRGEKFNGEYKLIGSASKNDSSFHDNNAVALKTYYYYIETVDRMGNKLFPTAKIPGIYRSASKPMPPYVVAEGLSGGVKLSIKLKQKNIRGYRIYRSLQYDTTKLLISALVPFDTNKQFTVYFDKSESLSGSFFYTYYVQTESASYALSDLSNGVTVRPGIETKPSAPTNVNVETQSRNSVITWNNIIDTTINTNIIFRKMQGESNYKKIGESKTEYYIDTTAIQTTRYEYRIQSMDNFGGLSDFSYSVATESRIIEPLYVTGLIIYMSNGKPILEWSNPVFNGMKNIQIYRYEKDIKPIVAATLSATDKTWTDITAKKGRSNFYYITIVDNNGKENPKSDETGISIE